MEDCLTESRKMVKLKTTLVEKEQLLQESFKNLKDNTRIEENSSKTTRRKQLAENNSSKILGGKLVEKQLAENSPAENSSQE